MRSARLSARRWTSASRWRSVGRRLRWPKSIVPPDHLGEPTPANPDPFFVAIVDKMLGFLPVEPSTDPSIITGVAASPGTAQGTAKVVRTLVEASKLQQGDIMVCEMTVPTWVPLFATVRAVVADSGGILSHCAIVAREFGLPAVVGTRVGTDDAARWHDDHRRRGAGAGANRLALAMCGAKSGLRMPTRAGRVKSSPE